MNKIACATSLAAVLLAASTALAFDLKEETPSERCDTGQCMKDCNNRYANNEHGDAMVRRVLVALCKSTCDEDRNYCLSHDGASVTAIDIAPSSFGKEPYLFCMKHYTEAVRLGVKSDCDVIRSTWKY